MIVFTPPCRQPYADFAEKESCKTQRQCDDLPREAGGRIMSRGLFLAKVLVTLFVLLTAAAGSGSVRTADHGLLSVHMVNIQTASCQPHSDGDLFAIDLRRASDTEHYFAKVSVTQKADEKTASIRDLTDRLQCVALGNVNKARGQPFLNTTCVRTLLFDLDMEDLICSLNGDKSGQPAIVTSFSAVMFDCRQQESDTDTQDTKQGQSKEGNESSQNGNIVIDIDSDTHGKLRFESQTQSSRELEYRSLAPKQGLALCRDETSQSRRLVVVVSALTDTSPFSWSEASCSLQGEVHRQVVDTVHNPATRAGVAASNDTDCTIAWVVAGVVGLLSVVVVVCLVCCLKRKTTLCGQHSAAENTDKLDTSKDLLLTADGHKSAAMTTDDKETSKDRLLDESTM